MALNCRNFCFSAPFDGQRKVFELSVPSGAPEGSAEGMETAREEVFDKSRAAREKLIEDLEKKGVLWDAMKNLGDDPSYSGRLAFIEDKGKRFIQLVNHYLKSPVFHLSLDAENLGYRKSDNAEQNIAFFKAYLAWKRHEDLGKRLPVESMTFHAEDSWPTEGPKAVAAAPATSTKTTRMASSGDSYDPDFARDPNYDPDLLAREKASIPEGGLLYHEPGTEYVGDLQAAPVPTLNDPLDLDTDVPEEVPDVRLVDLLGKSVNVPQHFRGETSYEAIEKIKTLRGGQMIYDAIRMLAAIHRKHNNALMDNRTLWETLRGGMLKGGGRYEIQFDEIAKAVYGKNEKKLTESLSYFKEFKFAANTLLESLDKAEETSADVDSYKSLRESIVYTGEQAYMAHVAEAIFDRNSYGPPISLNAFQAIVYALERKKRPEVNEDNWLTPAARRQGEFKSYGETEVISHTAVFDKLMKTETVNAFVKEMNLYLQLGEDHLNRQAALGFGKKVDVPTFTAEQIQDLAFSPNADQIACVRHGAMIVAASELAVYQTRETASSRPGSAPTSAEAGAEAAPEGVPGASPEAVPEGISPVAAEMAHKAALGEGLTEEQEKQLAEQAHQALQGFISGYVATHDLQNLNDWNSYSAGVAAGVHIPLWEHFKLGFTLVGQTVVPHIIGKADITYESGRFGKNDRMRLKAYGGLSASKEGVGPHGGLEFKWDLKKGGPWALDAGIHASIYAAAANLGVERDLGRVLEKRIENFKEKHPEMEGELAKAYASIDALDVSAAQKEALKQGAREYMDYQIAYGVTRDYAKWYKQIKFAGAGLCGAAGWKGGLAAGVYVKFGVGFRPVTFYVPPLETPEQLRYSARTGLPSVLENAPLPEADWVKLEVTDHILQLDDESNESALARADANAVQSLEAMQAGVHEDVLLTRGDRFTDFELKNVNGNVRLYVDGKSGIETVVDDPENIMLNLDRDDHLLVRILEIPAAQGTDNMVIASITNDPAATLDDVISRSPSYIQWNQVSNGKKRPNSIVPNPAGSGDNLIMTRPEIEAKIVGGSIQLGDLAKEGVQEHLRTARFSDLEALAGVREARLFAELSEDDRNKADRVAAKLIGSGIDYDRLATRGRNAEVNQKIIKLYAADGIPNPSVDHIYLARQYAMEKTRPAYDQIPLGWNERAFQKLAGEFSKIATDYFKKHKQEIVNGTLKGEFPEGTEFYIYINESGEMKVLQGYYDEKVHGDMMAPLRWNAKNPKETLGAMGLADTVNNRKSVEKIASAIEALEWETTPYNSKEITDFQGAMDTMTGAMLLSSADELYGKTDADALRQMFRDGKDTLNPALAQEFTEDIKELLADGTTVVRQTPVLLEWETRSGLYKRCFNLVVGRNPVLKFIPPGKIPVQSASTREKVSSGMAPKMRVKYTEVVVAPMPTVKPITPKARADEEGGGYQGESADEGDTETGEDPSSQGEHPTI